MIELNKKVEPAERSKEKGLVTEAEEESGTRKEKQIERRW